MLWKGVWVAQCRGRDRPSRSQLVAATQKWAVRTCFGGGPPASEGTAERHETHLYIHRIVTLRDVTDVTQVPVIAQFEATAGGAASVDAGLLIACLHRLAELGPVPRMVYPPARPGPSAITTALARRPGF